MIISRSDLLLGLEAVKGSVADKPIVPIMTHVLFSGKRLLAYDSEIGISVELPTEVPKAFNIRHSGFLSLVKGLSSEDVEINVEGKKIQLKCGSHKSTFTQIEEAYPEPNVKPTPEQWQDVPAGFKEGLERALLAVSADESNVVLASLYVEGKHVFGCDSKRGVRCTVENMNLKPMLLSTKAAKEVVKLGNPKRIAVTQNAAVFDYVNTLLLARLREGKYPANVFEHHLDKAKRKADHPVPDGFKEALMRLRLFAKGLDQPKVIIENNGLMLAMTAQDTQDSAEEMLPKWPLEFAKKSVDPARIIDILQFAECMDFGAGPNDPLYFNGETAGFEAMVMPMTL